MDTIETTFEWDSALVFGIGGSGDVVGSIPTARMLEIHDVDVLLGGIAWEPTPYDTQVGPRALGEIENIQRLNDTVGITTGDAETSDGVRFKESFVAEHFDRDVALLDVTRGVGAMRDGIASACDDLDVDGVVGVDVGGDVLAAGDEPGLRSPLTDAYGLVVLDELECKSCLGMFGYGSDGELTHDELEDGIARAARDDGYLGAWGLTHRVRLELEQLLEEVETEASRLPVQAARGEYGKREIRGGAVSLRVTPPSVVTFYFNPSAVAATSEIATLVRGTKTFEESAIALREAGITTELDTGRERMQSG